MSNSKIIVRRDPAGVVVYARDYRHRVTPIREFGDDRLPANAYARVLGSFLQVEVDALLSES